MNFNKFKLLLLNLFLVTIINAQIEEKCGFFDKTDEEMNRLPWFNNTEYLDRIVDEFNSIQENQIESRGDDCISEINRPIFVPIKFWIYQDAAGTGIPDNKKLQNMMDALNAGYENNGLTVQFFMECPFANGKCKNGKLFGKINQLLDLSC